MFDRTHPDSVPPRTRHERGGRVRARCGTRFRPESSRHLTSPEKTESFLSPRRFAPPLPRQRKALRGGVDTNVEGRPSAPFGVCGQRFAKSRGRLARDEARDVGGGSAR